MKNIISFILFFPLITSLLLADEDWTQNFPNSNPGNMTGHSMAYIGDDKILLCDHGNYGFDQFNKTWVYDLSDNTWTRQYPANAPDSRWLHGMAYIGDDKVLLFSGDRNGIEDVNDTWVYDLSDNTWTNMSPQNAPEARSGYGIAYIGGDKIIIYGGNVDGSIGYDTWIYDLSDNTWTQVSPWPQPSARNDHAMCYIGDDKAILFGGGSWSATPNDTWIYDLSDNTWTNMNPTNSPIVRVGHDMAYMGNGKAFLFGGEDQDNNIILGDAWVYDLSTNNWTEDNNSNNPSARNLFGIATTNMTNPTRLLLYAGGDYSSDNDETWLFGGGDYKLGLSDLINSIPNTFTVIPAYPNPFNPSTTITFGLDKDSHVVIDIYDITGNLISTLQNECQTQGWHSVIWNGTNQQGNKVSAGIYLSRIIVGNNVKTFKLMFLK